MALVAAGCDPLPLPDGRDLGVSVAAAPTTLAVGEPTTIEATVTNHGSTTASAARVAWVSAVGLPTIDGPSVGACFGSVGGPIGSETPAVLDCSIGDLAPGASVSIDVEIIAEAPTPSALIHLATGSDGAEPTDDEHANVVSLPVTVVAA